MNRVLTVFKSTTFLIFIFTAILVYFILERVLALHLNYGFRDGDWILLITFKELGSLSLEHFVKAWEILRVYTYQVYYIGLLEHLYGIDFYSMNKATHFVKYLGTLAIFPLVMVLTGRKLAAFCATVIFAVAYPAMGILYHTVIGGYHITFISLSMFLISYYFIVSKRKSWRWYFLLSFLFTLTLLLTPERMYPLFPYIILVEFFILIKIGISKKSILNSVTRLGFMYFPFITIYLLYPSVFVHHLGNFYARFENLFKGNYQFLLFPFASFGSMFVPNFYLPYLGSIRIESFGLFIRGLLLNHLIIFLIVSFLLAKISNVKTYRFVGITILSTLVLSIIAFLLASHWYSLDPKVRVNFDYNFVLPPALVGIFIISLTFAYLIEWLKTREQKNYSKLLFASLASAFLFIVATWGAADLNLVFIGAHRYLAAPSIGTSIFFALLLTLIYDKLRSRKLTKPISLLTLLILFPIISVNERVTREFFLEELYFVGMDYHEQTRLKNEFWSYVPNLDNNKRSLFYFDESQSSQYGYLNESAVMAGFEYWFMFDGNNYIRNRPLPAILRTNTTCPKPDHQSCLSKLKEGLKYEEGEWKIYYQDHYFKLKNFYAMRFIGKQLSDIRDEVINDLNLKVN